MDSYLLYAIIFAIIVRLVYRTYQDPLKVFPGPTIARWTDLWRVWDAITTTHSAPSLIELHKKHGDIVRIAPNVLSFAHPQALRDIYGAEKRFQKSQMYPVGAAVAGGRANPSLFSSNDTAWHDNLRRAVQPAFNLSSLVQYEPFVSGTVSTFVTQLSNRFADRDGEDGVVDLSSWMHWYAFDVIGALTYGSRFGFLEQATDIDGIIRRTDEFLAYVSVVLSAPWLDVLFLKNPLLLWLNRRGWFTGTPNPAVAWALKWQKARIEAVAKGEHTVASDGRVDLLDKFLQAREKHPDTVGDREVLGMGLSMVFAGSETTAITLTAIFYFLLKHPAAYKRLQREIDENLKESEESGSVSFHAARKLPYLDACIQETFRLHPAARFSSERLVPASGARISGQLIPPHTVVGMNAWVLHRRGDVFGDDVDDYRPERWLPGESGSDNLAEMSRCLFQFGMDKFNCIGKNISLLEMYKVVPSLLKAFEFQLKDPQKDWTIERGGFVNVSGVDVRIRRRR